MPTSSIFFHFKELSLFHFYYCKKTDSFYLSLIPFIMKGVFVLYFPIYWGFIICVLFILCGLLGISIQAFDFFIDAIPTLLVSLIVILLILAIHRLISFFRQERYSFLYWVDEAVMLLSIIPGIGIFMEFTDIDRCCRWFSWFDEGTDIRFLTYTIIVLAFSTAMMTIGFFLPSKILSHIILFLPIIFPFCIYIVGMPICAKSYSDYITTNFTSESILVEYQVTEDSRIYYPSRRKDEQIWLFPSLLSSKYSNAEFKEGEIVYLLESKPLDFYKSAGYTYVNVSNGTIGGVIEIDNLQSVSTPQYTYKIQTIANQSSVYKADIHTMSGTLQSWHRTDEVIENLPQNTILTVTHSSNYSPTDDGYLRILLPDGTGGFISRDNVSVVRTPI